MCTRGAPTQIHVSYRDGLFAVDVEPLTPAYQAQSYATWRAAMRVARGIRESRGWPIIDRTLAINLPPPRAA